MLINNMESYEQALEFLSKNDLVAFDIETSGLNKRKDVVIGFSFSNATEGYYFPMKEWNGQSLQDVAVPFSFKTFLYELKTKKLITWNGAFDIPFVKNYTGIDLIDALHCDAMLLKHTCDEEFPFGLKEVGAKIYGIDAKQQQSEMLESVKAAGGSSKEYYKATTETLAKYAIQDACLTFKLFNHYSKELQKQGLEAFFYNDEVMPLYRQVVIPMENHGIKLDMPKLVDAQINISNDIFNIEQSIQKEIAPMLSIFTKWFLNKDYPPQTPTGKMPAWAKKGLTQQEAFKADYPGQEMFNLQSKHHLKKLFFDTLNETPLSRTPTGQPQVDEDFLESIAPKYDWVKQIIVYNKLIKIKGTYIDRFIEEQENGIFYPNFMQHRTTSGRLSSDLQQLPRPLEQKGETDMVAKYTNILRSFFVSRDGSSMVGADYEQLEPTIFAHNSADSGLCAIFNNGLDFYSEIAIRTEGLTSVSSDKAADNYLGKCDKPKRQKAKAYALGIAYGMTAYKLKFEINCSEAEAERLVKDYFNAFPKLKETMDNLQLQARTKGFVLSQGGRMRRVPQAVSLHAKYGDKLSNGLELWKAYHEMPSVYAQAKEAAKTYKNLMNNALNFPIQSLAASIVSRASIEIMKQFKALNLKAILIMNIHDELVAECLDSEVPQVCEIMQNVMENVVKLSVPLRAVPQIGKKYSETK